MVNHGWQCWIIGLHKSNKNGRSSLNKPPHQQMYSSKHRMRKKQKIETPRPQRARLWIAQATEVFSPTAKSDKGRSRSGTRNASERLEDFTWTLILHLNALFFESLGLCGLAWMWSSQLDPCLYCHFARICGQGFWFTSGLLLVQNLF